MSFKYAVWLVQAKLQIILMCATKKVSWFFGAGPYMHAFVRMCRAATHFCAMARLSCGALKCLSFALCNPLIVSEFPKGRLLPSKRCPFSVQFVPFWKVKAYLLQNRRSRAVLLKAFGGVIPAWRKKWDKNAFFWKFLVFRATFSPFHTSNG